MSHPERLNIAVFIDFDNIEIGVKTTLNEHFDVGIVLDGIKERGEVVTKIAYADWTRAGEYSRHLTQHAIRLVQRNLTPGGDKNGADINLALDALEMVFTHQHINAYVIVGGDSDFLSLVEKLKQYDKKVFVVGGRAFTSVILQRNCHEFIAYENLNRSRKPAAKGERPVVVVASAPIAQAFAIVRRALKILSDREVSPQTGLLKSTLLQLDSTFSERNYGASSFLDFVEKLAKSGLVQLKHSGRSVMVELNEAFDETDASGPKIGATTDGAGEGAVAPAYRPATDSLETPADGVPSHVVALHTVPLHSVSSHSGPSHIVTSQGVQHAQPMHVEQIGTNADGVKLAADILRSATTARWPMYLRNVKQILRAYRGDGAPGASGDGGFDERRYGFGGLMDLLRACQRESLVRVERDRRGGLRVFPGQGIQRAGAPPLESASPSVDAQNFDVQPNVSPEGVPYDSGNVRELVEDAEPVDPGQHPIDTTAELLGRAKHRRPRTRTPAAVAAPAAAPRGTRKAAGRKPAVRRTTRAKKTSSE